VKPRGREHRTVRAFAIILAIVCLVVIFQLYATLMVAAILLQIAFFLAVAFFLVALTNLGLYFGARLFAAHSLTINGLTGVAWLLVFPLCALAIWRSWREQHTYY
jgi:hypothetical protein